MDGEDEAEYADWVAAHWNRLVHAAVLLGAGFHEAEDLVQQTLVQAYVQWPRVARARHREAYVSRMLLNTLRASRRRRWRGERPTGALPEPRSAASAADDVRVADADAVERALGGLSEAQRAVVVLRLHLDLSEAEVAGVLGIAPGTVKSRLARALAHLRGDAHVAELRRRG